MNGGGGTSNGGRAIVEYPSLLPDFIGRAKNIKDEACLLRVSSAL